MDTRLRAHDRTKMLTWQGLVDDHYHYQTKCIGIVVSPAPLHYPAHFEAEGLVGSCA